MNIYKGKLPKYRMGQLILELGAVSEIVGMQLGPYDNRCDNDPCRYHSSHTWKKGDEKEWYYLLRNEDYSIVCDEGDDEGHVQQLWYFAISETKLDEEFLLNY